MRPPPAKLKGKRLTTALEFHFRIYDEFDKKLAAYIREQARLNERSVPQQVRYMLRQAQEVGDARD